MNRAAVLGSPITHSLSPVLHRAAYRALGLDWRYDAHEVDEAGLPAFVAGLGPEWAGLSLTMPLKTAVIPLLDEVTSQADLLQAVNTVVLRDGRRTGSNTDAPGLATAARRHGVAAPSTVTVLGGGATARSALAAAAELGAGHADLVVRDTERHATRLRALGDRLTVDVAVHPWQELSGPGADVLLSAPLVVSTVPAAAGTPVAATLPTTPRVLFDVLYSPWPTPLATAWQARGGVVIGGFELLLAQAALQVEAMTGAPAPVDDMRSAGEAALAAR